MKRTVLLLIISIFVACDKKPVDITSLVVNYSDSTFLPYELSKIKDYSTSKLHGWTSPTYHNTWIYFDSINGLPYTGKVFKNQMKNLKVYEGELSNGLRSGHWIFFRKHHNYKSELISYENGMKHGLYQKYAKDSTIIIEGQYSRGEKIGKWSFYSTDAKVDSQGYYKNNKRDSLWIIMGGEHKGHFINDVREGYWEEGNGHVSGYYKNGRRVGKWKIIIDGVVSHKNYTLDLAEIENRKMLQLDSLINGNELELTYFSRGGNHYSNFNIVFTKHKFVVSKNKYIGMNKDKTSSVYQVIPVGTYNIEHSLVEDIQKMFENYITGYGKKVTVYNKTRNLVTYKFKDNGKVLEELELDCEGFNSEFSGGVSMFSLFKQAENSGKSTY